MKYLLSLICLGAVFAQSPEYPILPGGGGGGSGSVTSVAQAVPAWLSVTGSPITTAGVITVTANSGQMPGQVIGTCGTATTFCPCSLVAGDLPAGTGTVTSVGQTVPSWLAIAGS